MKLSFRAKLHRVPVISFGLVACVCLLAGCASTSPLGPPSAKEILAKPAQASSLKDGHFKVTGSSPSDSGISSAFSGEGDMLFRPRSALHLVMTGQAGVFNIQLDMIQVDGKQYTKIGNQKYSEAPGSSSTAGSTAWASAKDPKLLGEETLLNDKAWHVQAQSEGSAFDVWVREKDGYPLKYQGGATGGSGQFTLQFTAFNTGAKIEAPSSAQIKQPPKNVTGSVGAPLTLNGGGTVTIVAANSNAQPGNPYSQPKSGNRFVSIEVLYDNAKGTDKLSYGPYDWKVADSQGFNYDSTYAGIEPGLHSGDLNSGDKVRGFITFDVPKSATGLQVKTKFGEDTWAVPLN